MYYFLRHYKGTTNFRIIQIFTTLFCIKYNKKKPPTHLAQVASVKDNTNNQKLYKS